MLQTTTLMVLVSMLAPANGQSEPAATDPVAASAELAYSWEGEGIVGVHQYLFANLGQNTSGAPQNWDWSFTCYGYEAVTGSTEPCPWTGRFASLHNTPNQYGPNAGTTSIPNNWYRIQYSDRYYEVGWQKWRLTGSETMYQRDLEACTFLLSEGRGYKLVPE